MKPRVFPRPSLWCITFVVFLLSGLALANSGLITYQGTLRLPSGLAVADGDYAMTFIIYDADTGGSALWTESHGAVAVADGLFAVQLGAVESFGNLFADHASTWLEIEVDTGAGLEAYGPRVPLASAPYAQHAENANTVSGESAGHLRTPAGGIISFGGAAAPSGWLLCDGAAVSRTDYAGLFAVVGTTYGAGDGATTFNLPNLSTRVPVGHSEGDAEFGALGQQGGAKTHTLAVSEMPSHTHTQDPHNHTQQPHGHSFSATNVGWPQVTDQGFGRDWTGWGGGGNWINQPSIQNTTATNTPATAVNQNTGGSQPHNNLQPYVVVNYIIKY